MSTPLSPEFIAAVKRRVVAGYVSDATALPASWTAQQRCDYAEIRAVALLDQIAAVAGPLHEDLVTGWSKRNRGRSCDESVRKNLWDSTLQTLTEVFVDREFADDDEDDEVDDVEDAYDDLDGYDNYWPRSG